MQAIQGAMKLFTHRLLAFYTQKRTTMPQAHEQQQRTHRLQPLAATQQPPQTQHTHNSNPFIQADRA